MNAFSENNRRDRSRSARCGVGGVSGEDDDDVIAGLRPGDSRLSLQISGVQPWVRPKTSCVTFDNG